MYASLKSIGGYAPSHILSNVDLEKMVETTDEWIEKRTGIKERRIAADDETTSDLGVKAALLAISRAGIAKEEIDLIICATLSPDYLCMPSTACVIAGKLGINDVMAFDISAACSGFVYMLSMAKAFIESGMKKNILLIGAEKISSMIDYTDRGTCILFGDGAGAAIIGATEDKNEAILDIHASADGRYGDLLITPGCGSKYPCSQETLDNKLNYIKMQGNEVYKVAVKTLTNDVIDILENNNITASQVDHFIPHQANFRIIEAVRAKLNFPIEKTVLTVAKYGNTSAASIPMAMNDAYEEGRIKKGDLMLLDTFGGGFTWASALVRFGGH
ncbi:beta-ketoacyl-ACP synthase III [Sulfurospirillum multivorans]|uniref:Beta-ketoacyl-[acyl-carrier-protein] synthase III n=2 Tax=Sulfurospirillum multivorans TaxID=66821 RepID=A0AA86DYF7_SULMK|nr:beta-ketoacyl-ACP synthase III [Sulfurospirillum multivorans]AHJ11590.1 3-oxoacyl-[acyl-carrier-protein] synthase, KASIII [Sulfurospirillum multivorans DSM 12446]QEH05090.1 3-oxoacyl-[acyl-carrier-protein] synthase, KASIII [Sulfurospirillum multivorans]